MWKLLIALAIALGAGQAAAQPVDYAARLKEGDALLKDFRFRTGERLAQVRMHYATLGTPRRDSRGVITNAVMILHGTGGTGRQFLQPQFAGELFGPGQPLDIARYFVILPDNLGHGASSKPSDGLRMRFPQYDYDDMVEAQRRMLAERVGVTKLRLLMGTSMGCMHAFVWAETHPDFARAIMPLACFPIEIAGHNRMWRRLAIEGIRKDPAWANGDYASQPVQGLRTAASILQIAGFAPRYLQHEFPTRGAADAYIVERVERDIGMRDANDLIYQLEASRNYDPRPGLERIRAPILWINSEDDFINPAGNEAVTILHDRLPTVHYVLVPQSPETRGHGTHTWARFWKQWVVELLRRTEVIARPPSS
jgi:homoserine O-acetyltransferase